ncbi:MAG: hypothetical protein V1792_13475, partial [Pseudomonadota bacterium]
KPDTDELVFWMMTLELGLRSKRKGWATWLTQLLERRVRELIEQSPELYERLLKYAFVVLVESDVSQTAKNRFKHFLFSSPYPLHKSNKLRSHFEAVLALLRTGRNGEEACEWIERLAMSKSIDFRTRRDLVGEVVDAYDDLPIAVKTEVTRVLGGLSHYPEWIIIELLRFQEDYDGQTAKEATI